MKKKVVEKTALSARPSKLYEFIPASNNFSASILEGYRIMGMREPAKAVDMKKAGA